MINYYVVVFLVWQGPLGTITVIFKFLAKWFEKCNSSWEKKTTDYNYISEFQEKFILQKWHLQLHF